VSSRLASCVVAVALTSTTAVADPSPDEHYRLHCSGCHGADGHGARGVTPSLHGLATLLGLSGGRAYLAQVPGVAQAPLDDADLAALLNWVISEFSGTVAAQPYSAVEIGDLRARPLRDPAAARSKIVR
jgi:mono/diheme cytochrome c family protein